MSRETLTTLNTQTLIGYTDKRGQAWHYRACEQGGESNHYPRAIPVEDLYRRLFNWSPIEGTVRTMAITADGVLTIDDPDRKTIIRPDTETILGIFKKGYKIHGYSEWLVHNVESILDAELQIGSAGLLRGGAQAWVQVEMEDTLEVEGVAFRPFLTAATSLDGSIATTYDYGVQVVVCDNTLSASLGVRNDRRLKVKHSRNSLGKIGSVRDALGIVHKAGDAFAAQVRRLTDEVVSDARWAAFVDVYAEASSDTKRAATIAGQKADELHRLWNHDSRVAPWQGTAYGVIAAVNTYAHHVQEVRGADRATRNMERMISGGVDQLDASTLALLATV